MRRLFFIPLLLITSFVFAQKKQITLENIWRNGTFAVKSVPGFNAMNDGVRYTKNDAVDGRQVINVYNLETGEKEKTLFDNAQKFNDKTLVVHDYSFSNDETKMLLFTEAQNIYRRSVLYKTYLYNIATQSLVLIDENKVLHASLSPDNNKVAFVKDNNLYYRDLQNGEVVTVTTDGKRNEIINGNCDWVYEEEFEFTKAYEWAPDGKHIAYYRFDERLVPEYTMTVYDSLYPTPYKYKYPKAGESNSIVQIKIYDVAKKQVTNANIGSETDQYIPRIKWTKDPNSLCIFRMNRHQNKLELLLANAADGTTNVIYKEENPYYIEINDNIQFLPDNESFIFNSEMSGYNHFYRWNWKKQKLTKLTSGNYDIDQLTGIDEAKKTLYYTAAETSPLERKLYSVNWDGKNKKVLTTEPGTHAITPINGYKYFLDKHSRLNTPPAFYMRDINGKIVRTLEDNKDLANKMKEYDLGDIQFKQFPGDSALLNAWVIMPPNFDSSKKYPVLMFQYSGPGSQNVADRFPVADFFWHQMLAQKGYIIVCADGTGTGFRGERFTYLTLGNLESNDQIAVAKHLGSLQYVDKNRIGIWGWSYGGFMSSICIFKGHDVFKSAIAVAPVTNWRFYDNIYTERYMRTPAENPKGYDDNAPEKMAKILKGKFLLIHGTSDDNVHFQNQVSLVDALIKANKEFDSEFYPNKAHGISGGATRFHLYKRMTEFILNNL
ncbi:MAG TPA: S9 family peptidase [Flavipsychrobacter sp.]|nr:S9 family peptidase [Flavipsychrobacter sp.]